MKILFVAWRDLANPLAGGSEVLIDRLARGLVERGHDVSLLCGGPVAPRPYNVRRAGGKYTQYIAAPLHYLARFRDADLVVEVANGMPYFAPLWRRKPALCLVNHIHTEQWGQWFPRPVAALGRALERDGLPLVYRKRLFVTVSPSSAESLAAIGVAPESIRIVPNGTEVPEDNQPKPIEPLFLSLGRLVPHKRFDLVLDAWERVRARVGGTLVVAGSGPEEKRLAAMAGDGVQLVGQVSEDQKQRLLSEAWVLLHPAEFEGWGLVVMEAAARNTPTVGFDVRGLRDSIVHGQTGLLATSRDSFVEHWLSLAENAALRRAVGARARARAASFTWSRSVDKFVAVAREAIGREPSPEVVAPAGFSPAPLRDDLEVAAAAPRYEQGSA